MYVRPDVISLVGWRAMEVVLKEKVAGEEVRVEREVRGER